MKQGREPIPRSETDATVIEVLAARVREARWKSATAALLKECQPKKGWEEARGEMSEPNEIITKLMALAQEMDRLAQQTWDIKGLIAREQIAIDKILEYEARIRDLEAALRAVVEKGSGRWRPGWLVSGADLSEWCGHCGVHWKRGDEFLHDPDCPIAKAKTLLDAALPTRAELCGSDPEAKP